MRTWIVTLIIATSVPAWAQVSVSDVKLSGNFHWGEGFSADRQQAIELARQDLVQKIVVTITADQNLQIVDDGVSVNSKFELRSRSLSRMQLRGLDYTVTERRDKSFQVLAYVGKAEFNEGIAELRARIHSQMDQMWAAKRRGDTSQAIQQAFDILVQTYFVPVPILTEDADSGRNVDVQSFLRNELVAWIRAADVVVERVVNRSAPGHTELILVTRVRFGTEPASQMLLQYNRPGYGEHPVRNGSADVFMDVEPERPVQNIELNLLPAIPASFDADMRQLAEQIRPVRVVPVPVDFKGVITVDFSAARLLGNGYRFTATFTNLSVFDLMWDFGNGETSSVASPRVEIADIGPAGRPVTLTVNRSPDLVVRKVLHSDGQLRAPVESRNLPVVANTLAPTPAPATNALVALDLVALSHRNQLDPILRIRNAAALTDHLEGLSRQNRVRYGRSVDVGPVERSYVAIVDPTDRSVRAVLTPVLNGVRYELSTNTPVSPESIRERYQGMGSIWFVFQ